jgi:hypothetical protein
LTFWEEARRVVLLAALLAEWHPSPRRMK